MTHPEDVLDVYTRNLPCSDEGSKELQGKARSPLPSIPGFPERFGTEYERHGSVYLFPWSASLLGQRGVAVTARRTRTDFSHPIRDLVDLWFPDAERIVLVVDNLNSHDRASLYLTFPPAERKWLSGGQEVRHAPKHGNWLNVAQTELDALAQQGLSRRVALAAEAAAWLTDGTTSAVTVIWLFTTADAGTSPTLLRTVSNPSNDDARSTSCSRAENAHLE